MKIDLTAILLLVIAAMLAYVVYQSNALVKATTITARYHAMTIKETGKQKEFDAITL